MLLSLLHAGARALRITKSRVLNRLDPPVVVLLYHRVTNLDSDPQMLAVTPENFRAQMKFLKSRFPLLRFEDSWKEVTTPSVVVTFDDGYADNAQEALPILEELGVPASFFVSTEPIKTGKGFWWDELEHIILGTWSFPPCFELRDRSYGRTWQAGTASERSQLYHEIQFLMKRAHAECREDWLNQLRKWADAPEYGSAQNRAMTIDELRSLDKSAWVTVGAHTVTHTCLSAVSPEEQKEEIIDSKQQLESWLGNEITIFSYPFGERRDYNQSSIKICRDASFVKAASNFSGQAHRWTDPYQIPRQLVRNWPLEIFKSKIDRFCVL